MRGQQLPFRRIRFRRPVRPHCGMRVITHLMPMASPNFVEAVVTPSPPRDKHSISCGRVLHLYGARTFLSALGLRGAPGRTGMSALLAPRRPEHPTSNSQPRMPGTVARRKSRREPTWISMPDQKWGPEAGLWYQGMSRVVPDLPQTTPSEARQASCIRKAYIEHRTLSLEP
jgi:hypothetical protein